MNRLFYTFLMVSVVTQGSLIIHKSIDYLDSSSKAAVIHTDSKLRIHESKNLTSDYWNFLKAEEGDDSLYSLITQETVAQGNKDYGLLPQDVGQIQDDLCRYKMFNNSETFAHIVLPAWLEEVYENKQKALEEKIDLNDPTFQLWKENNIHLGLVSYLIQSYHQKASNHEKYLYRKKYIPLGPKTEAHEIKNFVSMVQDEAVNYLNVEDIGKDQHENVQYSHIIVSSKDFFNEKNKLNLKNDLRLFLDDNPEVTVVIAFNDQEVVIAFNDQETKANIDFMKNFNIQKLLIIGKSLKKIKNNFFACCTTLRELEILDEVEEVGDCFFRYCSSLEKLKIRGLKKVGNSFLSWCTGLKELDISVEEIGDNFLSDCTNLEKLNIRGLKKTGKNFLFGCSGLKELDMSIEEIGDKIFNHCISLEKLRIRGLKKAGKSFIVDSPCLKELELPYELEVEDHFFHYCSSLKKLNIKGLKKTGNYFFRNCSGLKELDISVEEIGDNFLSDCTNLEKLKIRGLKKVGKNFLSGCSGLKELDISEEVGDGFFSNWTSLEKLKIRGLKKVGNYFCCNSLKELDISVEEIGDNFFNNCTSLEKLNIRGLKKIGKWAFFSCSGLKELELPEELEEVGNYFLENCGSLEKLIITEALYNKLKKDNNFSDISNRISSLSTLKKIEIIFKNSISAKSKRSKEDSSPCCVVQ